MKPFSAFGAAAAIVLGALTISSPAFAYIACSKGGDCWYSARNDIKVPNITFTYFPDSDLQRIKSDARYTWHESNGYNNWLNGFWLFGLWYNY